MDIDLCDDGVVNLMIEFLKQKQLIASANILKIEANVSLFIIFRISTLVRILLHISD